MDIDELRRQHADVIAIAEQLAEAVADDTQPRSVSALRWRLARLLLAHLAIEDDHFYPAMLARGNAAARATASRFQSEMGTLSAAFTRYMAAWTDPEIAAQWPRFCVETRAILAALGRRVEQENVLLYPLAPPDWHRRSRVLPSRTSA
ncbi:hemerythrin domain-containing protein [Sphingobium algorifonticola]|uniref:Hemerythrin domain-containing protein n=1 Tax=Sphingobium algorifonticola TaxID=2008318 RepID=A0A437JB05_9SPHN|nr:hemerythrin domain-containing protein [Sphingobium algorifonticola]RVT43087.1 hemerythrin domain-containing protein [Sphingobium algorifonticola]